MQIMEIQGEHWEPGKSFLSVKKMTSWCNNWALNKQGGDKVNF